MGKTVSAELERLIINLNPKAKLPRRFELWSEPLQVAWLRQNQRTPKEANVTCSYLRKLPAL
jgi:hypothetical protein